MYSGSSCSAYKSSDSSGRQWQDAWSLCGEMLDSMGCSIAAGSTAVPVQAYCVPRDLDNTGQFKYVQAYCQAGPYDRLANTMGELCATSLGTYPAACSAAQCSVGESLQECRIVPDLDSLAGEPGPDVPFTNESVCLAVTGETRVRVSGVSRAIPYRP
jgi:hypothetical protein